MPLHIPAGSGNVTYRFSLTGDPDVMTTSLALKGPVANVTDAETVAAACGAAMSLWVGDAWSSDYELVDVFVEWNVGGTLIQAEEAFGTPGGQPLADLPPNNCSLLVKKRTGLAGRANRGRMYFPPAMVDNSGIDNRGYLDNATLAAIQADVDTFFATVETIGALVTDAVLLHSETAPGVGPASTVVNDLQVQNQLATQRLRMRG